MTISVMAENRKERLNSRLNKEFQYLMADKVTLTIDGREVTVGKNSTILDAATRLGIIIPTFCWDPRLRSIAACRMCLVEVEKFPKLVPACATPVADGMVVKVNSERAVKGRRNVLEFQLVNHPLDCPTCDKGGECELQDHTFDHGPGKSRTVEPRNRVVFDGKYVFDEIPIGPVIWYNSNRCIKCFKCTRIIKEIAGDADLGAFKRGYKTILHPHPRTEFRSEFSGNTVENCPVGALVANSFRYRVRSWLLSKTPSVCHLCGDGCNTTLWHQGQKPFRVYTRWNTQVDDGLICDRGRFGALYADSDRRLKNPKIRKEGKLVDVGWTEALDFAAQKLQSIKEKNGPASIGVIGNEMLSNEEAFLLGRFTRQVVGSNNIDFRFEDRFTPSRELNLKLLGLLAGRVPYIDYKNYENIMVIGTDIEIRHPIVSLWIKKAIYAGRSQCIAVYHRKTDFTLHPVTSIEYFPQGEYNFLMILHRALKGEDISRLVVNAGVGTDDIKNLIERLKTGKTLFLAGEDLYNNPRGEHNIDLLKAIQGLLEDSRINILFDGSNYIGNLIWGSTPGILPVGMDNIYENRRELAAKWNLEKLPEDPGKTTNEMLKAGAEGEIKALIAVGADLVGFYPDREQARNALGNIEFKVSIETFLTETGKMCDVVLPLAAFPEYDGSLISTEGRLQYFRKAYDPCFSSAEGWRIILRLAQKMGFDGDYAGPADIWKEMTGMSGIFANIVYKGISFRGLLLDFESEEKRSLPDLRYADCSSFQPVDPPKPPEEYPLILTYGTSVYQKRHLTYYAESMDKIDPGPRIYLHPDNAGKLNLHDNDAVRVLSENGSLTMKLTTDVRVRPGTIFIPINFIEAEVNSLVSSDSGLTFVKLEKI